MGQFTIALIRPSRTSSTWAPAEHSEGSAAHNLDPIDRWVCWFSDKLRWTLLSSGSLKYEARRRWCIDENVLPLGFHPLSRWLPKCLWPDPVHHWLLHRKTGAALKTNKNKSQLTYWMLLRLSSQTTIQGPRNRDIWSDLWKSKKNSNPHGLDFSIDLAGKPVEAQLRHQWSMFLPSTRHGAD